MILAALTPVPLHLLDGRPSSRTEMVRPTDSPIRQGRGRGAGTAGLAVMVTAAGVGTRSPCSSARGRSVGSSGRLWRCLARGTLPTRCATLVGARKRSPSTCASGRPLRRRNSRTDEIVVATGVRPQIPQIAGIDHSKLASDTLTGATPGERIAVLGTGGIGVDVSQWLTDDRRAASTDGRSDGRRPH